MFYRVINSTFFFVLEHYFNNAFHTIFFSSLCSIFLNGKDAPEYAKRNDLLTQTQNRKSHDCLLFLFLLL